MEWDSERQNLQPSPLWLLAKGGTAPIASAPRPEQLRALIALRDLALTTEEVAEPDRAAQTFA